MPNIYYPEETKTWLNKKIKGRLIRKLTYPFSEIFNDLLENKYEKISESYYCKKCGNLIVDDDCLYMLEEVISLLKKSEYKNNIHNIKLEICNCNN